MDKIELAEVQSEVFEYLDVLRQSGAINMYGAAPYIQDEFDMNKRDARTMLMNYLKQ